MQTVEPADSFHLSAALGWLELGNVPEAKVELRKVSPDLQTHPDTLQIGWGLCAAEGDWPTANSIAEYLAKFHPEMVFGWIHLAHGLDHEGDIQSAYQLLEAVETCFPQEWLVPLNLAAYAQRLGETSSALGWLRKAFNLGGEQRVKNHLRRIAGFPESSSN